jgi:alpha-glucosidase
VYGDLAVDRQAGVKGTTLELYRELLRLRKAHGLGIGTLTWVEELPEEVVAFDVTAAGGGSVRVLTNLGKSAVPLPEGAEVLVASEPREGWVNGGVPTDATVWLRSAP